MLNIYIRVDGQRRELSELPDILTGAYAKVLQEAFNRALEPFHDEIESSGGRVEVDVSEDLKSVTLTTEGISDDLKDRIIEAMPTGRK